MSKVVDTWLDVRLMKVKPRPRYCLLVKMKKVHSSVLTEVKILPGIESTPLTQLKGSGPKFWKRDQMKTTMKMIQTKNQKKT